jgi:PAS domain S-box-containing protein
MGTRTDAKYLRAILKSNVLAMGCWRLGGHITAKNDALVSLIGYTNKEMKDGRIRMRDITPPEYQPLDLIALREARAQGECSPFEKEILHKTGRRIPVLMGGSMFEGRIDAGAFFFVDLRHRRRSLTPKRPVPDELFNFTDRQRAICLLLSHGEPDKRIATLLDLGLRTVELDKQRAASTLKLATGALAVWSVENRTLPLPLVEAESGVRGGVRSPLDPLSKRAIVAAIARYAFVREPSTGQEASGTRSVSDAARRQNHCAARRQDRRSPPPGSQP